jgi:hypothetical protein
MNETVKKLIDGLKNGTAKVNLNLNEFIGKDPKVDSLMSGKTTLPEFIQSIDDNDPFKVEEVRDNEFMVTTKKFKVHPMMRLPTNIATTFWDNVNTFKQVYPELAAKVDEVYREINTASCSSCVKNQKTNSLISEVLFYDNKTRDLTPLIPILGNKFIEAIKEEPVRPRPATPPVASTPATNLRQYHGVNKNRTVPSGGVSRPSCLNCVRKHLGQAIVLLGEAQQGYPNHKWLAVGHMAEAAEECLEFPEIANLLRAERLNIMDNPEYTPNLMPFFDMIEAVEKGIK